MPKKILLLCQEFDSLAKSIYVFLTSLCLDAYNSDQLQKSSEHTPVTLKAPVLQQQPRKEVGLFDMGDVLTSQEGRIVDENEEQIDYFFGTDITQNVAETSSSVDSKQEDGTTKTTEQLVSSAPRSVLVSIEFALSKETIRQALSVFQPAIVVSIHGIEAMDVNSLLNVLHSSGCNEPPYLPLWIEIGTGFSPGCFNDIEPKDTCVNAFLQSNYDIQNIRTALFTAVLRNEIEITSSPELTQVADDTFILASKLQNHRDFVFKFDVRATVRNYAEISPRVFTKSMYISTGQLRGGINLTYIDGSNPKWEVRCDRPLTIKEIVESEMRVNVLKVIHDAFTDMHITTKAQPELDNSYSNACCPKIGDVVVNDLVELSTFYSETLDVFLKFGKLSPSSDDDNTDVKTSTSFIGKHLREFSAKASTLLSLLQCKPFSAEYLTSKTLVQLVNLGVTEQAHTDYLGYHPLSCPRSSLPRVPHSPNSNTGAQTFPAKDVLYSAQNSIKTMYLAALGIMAHTPNILSLSGQMVLAHEAQLEETSALKFITREIMLTNSNVDCGDSGFSPSSHAQLSRNFFWNLPITTRSIFSLPQRKATDISPGSCKQSQQRISAPETSLRDCKPGDILAYSDTGAILLIGWDFQPIWVARLRAAHSTDPEYKATPKMTDGDNSFGLKSEHPEIFRTLLSSLRNLKYGSRYRKKDTTSKVEQASHFNKRPVDNGDCCCCCWKPGEFARFRSCFKNSPLLSSTDSLVKMRIVRTSSETFDVSGGHHALEITDIVYQRNKHHSQDKNIAIPNPTLNDPSFAATDSNSLLLSDSPSSQGTHDSIVHASPDSMEFHHSSATKSTAEISHLSPIFENDSGRVSSRVVTRILPRWDSYEIIFFHEANSFIVPMLSRHKHKSQSLIDKIAVSSNPVYRIISQYLIEFDPRAVVNLNEGLNETSLQITLAAPLLRGSAQWQSKCDVYDANLLAHNPASYQDIWVNIKQLHHGIYLGGGCRNAVAVEIVLNCPGGTVFPRLLRKLHGVLNVISSSEDRFIRGVVLKSASRAWFIKTMSLDELVATIIPGDIDTGRQFERDRVIVEFLRPMNQVIKSIGLSPFPIIVDLCCPTEGVGLDIAMACDSIVASSESYLLTTSALSRLGLPQMGMHTMTLRQRCGAAISKLLEEEQRPWPALNLLRSGVIDVVLTQESLHGDNSEVVERLFFGTVENCNPALHSTSPSTSRKPGKLSRNPTMHRSRSCISLSPLSHHGPRPSSLIGLVSPTRRRAHSVESIEPNFCTGIDLARREANSEDIFGSGSTIVASQERDGLKPRITASTVSQLSFLARVSRSTGPMPFSTNTLSRQDLHGTNGSVHPAVSTTINTFCNCGAVPPSAPWLAAGTAAAVATGLIGADAIRAAKTQRLTVARLAWEASFLEDSDALQRALDERRGAASAFAINGGDVALTGKLDMLVRGTRPLRTPRALAVHAQPRRAAAAAAAAAVAASNASQVVPHVGGSHVRAASETSSRSKLSIVTSAAASTTNNRRPSMSNMLAILDEFSSRNALQPPDLVPVVPLTPQVPLSPSSESSHSLSTSISSGDLDGLPTPINRDSIADDMFAGFAEALNTLAQEGGSSLQEQFQRSTAELDMLACPLDPSNSVDISKLGPNGLGRCESDDGSVVVRRYTGEISTCSSSPLNMQIQSPVHNKLLDVDANSTPPRESIEYDRSLLVSTSMKPTKPMTATHIHLQTPDGASSVVDRSCDDDLSASPGSAWYPDNALLSPSPRIYHGSKPHLDHPLSRKESYRRAPKRGVARKISVKVSHSGTLNRSGTICKKRPIPPTRKTSLGYFANDNIDREHKSSRPVLYVVNAAETDLSSASSLQTPSREPVVCPPAPMRKASLGADPFPSQDAATILQDDSTVDIRVSLDNAAQNCDTLISALNQPITTPPVVSVTVEVTKLRGKDMTPPEKRNVADKSELSAAYDMSLLSYYDNKSSNDLKKPKDAIMSRKVTLTRVQSRRKPTLRSRTSAARERIAGVVESLVNGTKDRNEDNVFKSPTKLKVNDTISSHESSSGRVGVYPQPVLDASTFVKPSVTTTSTLVSDNVRDGADTRTEEEEYMKLLVGLDNDFKSLNQLKGKNRVASNVGGNGLKMMKFDDLLVFRGAKAFKTSEDKLKAKHISDGEDSIRRYDGHSTTKDISSKQIYVDATSFESDTILSNEIGPLDVAVIHTEIDFSPTSTTIQRSDHESRPLKPFKFTEAFGKWLPHTRKASSSSIGRSNRSTPLEAVSSTTTKNQNGTTHSATTASCVRQHSLPMTSPNSPSSPVQQTNQGQEIVSQRTNVERQQMSTTQINPQTAATQEFIYASRYFIDSGKATRSLFPNGNSNVRHGPRSDKEESKRSERRSPKVNNTQNGNDEQSLRNNRQHVIPVKDAEYQFPYSKSVTTASPIKDLPSVPSIEQQRVPQSLPNRFLPAGVGGMHESDYNYFMEPKPNTSDKFTHIINNESVAGKLDVSFDSSIYQVGRKNSRRRNVRRAGRELPAPRSGITRSRNVKHTKLDPYWQSSVPLSEKSKLQSGSCSSSELSRNVSESNVAGSLPQQGTSKLDLEFFLSCPKQ